MLMTDAQPTKTQKELIILKELLANQAQEVEMMKSALRETQNISEENQRHRQLADQLLAQNMIDANGQIVQHDVYSANDMASQGTSKTLQKDHAPFKI